MAAKSERAATSAGTEQPSAELLATCEKLYETLTTGTENFFKRSDGGRSAAIIQLEAAIEFIEMLAVDEGEKSDHEFTRPLFALLLALTDLDSGVVAPMVAPSRGPTKGGRPSDTSARKMTQLCATLAMQMLMDLGLGRVPAAEAVAKVLRQGGVTLKRRGDGSIIDADAVIKWREQIQQSVRRNPESLQAELYHRDLDIHREHLKQMRRDGVDLTGIKIGDREIRNRILGYLAMFLVHQGETSDPRFGNWLWERDSPEEPQFD